MHYKALWTKLHWFFGSYARNEQSDKSDLDILIDFEGQIDLLGLIGLEQQLKDELNLRVDLIT